MDIVIPYGHGGRWEELRYFLRSVSSLKANITIYSEQDIDWIQNVNIIKVDRWYPKHIQKKWNGLKLYENYFDVLNKLKLASKNEELPNEIVWCYDDQVMLKEDFSIRYFKKPNLIPGRHTNTIKKALELSEGSRVFETHLPRVFRRDRLREMFDRFEIKKIPFAPATLYYNLFDGDYVEGVDNRADFYGTYGYSSESYSNIEEACEGKSWISYNNAGLTSSLKEWIINKFSNKSIYEKV